MSADGSVTRKSKVSNDLNALLGSRICHDLISPLGAISNGMELLELSGLCSSPEVSLINESVENANARIRFFRIAFGSGAPDATVSPNDVRDILASIGRGSRLDVEWEPGGILPRARVKLAFLLIQCFESAMPYGGTVRVAQKVLGWEISGMTDRMKVDTRLWEMIVNPMSRTEITPADVHFALVRPAADAAGFALDCDVREEAIRVAF